MDEHDKPVAWWHFNKGFDHCMADRLNEAAKQNPAPLYTRPAQWSGLTDEDTALLDWESFESKKACVQDIEALLREKNT